MATPPSENRACSSLVDNSEADEVLRKSSKPPSRPTTQIPAIVLVDILDCCGYNVATMVSITTKLIKDGNSVAVRLPKTVLAMSGLHGEVQLEVEKGQVTLRQAHP